MSALASHWSELVTVALLGTDRRDPPAPPDGPFADLAADLPEPTPSTRLLQQVAALTVVRRAGLTPGPVVDAVAAPDDDPRPVTPPAATDTWYRIVTDWAVVEDEFVLAVVQSGRRLAPELVVPVLARYRSDAVRHTRALAAAGPLGGWMIGWTPRLACAARRRPDPEAVAELPELAVTPDLAPLLAVTTRGDARRVADELATGLAAGRWGPSSRAVLVNLVARLHPAVLPATAHALDRVDPSSPGIGLAFALADLARLRIDVHAQLTPVAPASPSVSPSSPSASPPGPPVSPSPPSEPA